MKSPFEKSPRKIKAMKTEIYSKRGQHSLVCFILQNKSLQKKMKKNRKSDICLSFEGV